VILCTFFYHALEHTLITEPETAIIARFSGGVKGYFLHLTGFLMRKCFTWVVRVY